MFLNSFVPFKLNRVLNQSKLATLFLHVGVLDCHRNLLGKKILVPIDLQVHFFKILQDFDLFNLDAFGPHLSYVFWIMVAFLALPHSIMLCLGNVSSP